MKIGASLADVDPMQIDSSVSTCSVSEMFPVCMKASNDMPSTTALLYSFLSSNLQITQNISFVLTYSFWRNLIEVAAFFNI